MDIFGIFICELCSLFSSSAGLMCSSQSKWTAKFVKKWSWDDYEENKKISNYRFVLLFCMPFSRSTSRFIRFIFDGNSYVCTHVWEWERDKDFVSLCVETNVGKTHKKRFISIA